jgi:hypothetical protein
MGPNDVELVRVFTRRTGSAIADITFPFNVGFQVVLDAEAGNAIFAGGAQFEVGVVVRDLTDGTVIATTPVPPTPPPPSPAHLNAPEWPALANRFVYNVAAGALGAAKENHICEVLAFLRVNVTDPDVSFARSPLFIITRP